MTREEALKGLIKERDLEKANRDIWDEEEDRIKSDRYVEMLSIAIKALEQTGWIPISERLPEERDWYLVVFKETDTGFQLIPRVADYIGGGKNEWRLIDEDGLVKEYRDILECVAWMPLPERYQSQESEENKE